jgi:hypothetical protein
MAYTTIDDPSAYFQTKIYTGNGSTQDITFDGNSNLQPNFLWLKGRSLAEGHTLQNSVSGVTKHLHSQNTDVEVTDTGIVTAFNSNGFSLGDEGDVNGSSSTFVGWGWKAGTSFSNDASSTGIGDIDSSGSVNTDAGFSIITATSDGAADKDIAHGLGAVPDVIFAKNLVRTYNWDCYFKTLGYNASLILNNTDAPRTGAWGSNTFTTTTFETKEDFSSKSGEAYIYYCFAEKKGYSKFGSYTGNGNADGTFVYTGFKPAFVMTKLSSASGEGWEIYNNKALGYNVDNNKLVANTSGAESTADRIDLLSNGFKARINSDGINASGGTLIYMAFAENPFVTSSGVPACAR